MGRSFKPLRSVNLFAIVGGFLLIFPLYASGEDREKSYLPCDDGIHTTEYDLVFQTVGEIVGIDWCDLKAQAIEESGLDCDAESPKGAKGCAQFLDRTWDWLIKTYSLPSAWSVWNPVDALSMQGLYMSYLMERCRTWGARDLWQCAVASYNGGEGRVGKAVRALGRIAVAIARDAIPNETIQYGTKITSRAVQLRRGRRR